jgi:hypothetical protein
VEGEEGSTVPSSLLPFNATVRGEEIWSLLRITSKICMTTEVWMRSKRSPSTSLPPPWFGRLVLLGRT